MRDEYLSTAVIRSPFRGCPTNIQNIPRSQKDVKRAFKPKLDALMFFDYSNIEMRLLAFYLATIGDTSLAEEFKGGLDSHLETAKGLFPGQKVDDEMRQAGKTLNFSMIYGGGVPTIMKQLKVSRTEAARMLNAFHKARPGIRELNDAVWEAFQETGYIRTLYDRELHPLSKHLAVNALIQGCGGDLIRDAMLKIHEDLWAPWQAAHLVNSIHDELVIDTPESEVERLAIDIPRLMKNETIEKHIPIEVSIEISRTTWADKTEYECTSS